MFDKNLIIEKLTDIEQLVLLGLLEKLEVNKEQVEEFDAALEEQDINLFEGGVDLTSAMILLKRALEDDKKSHFMIADATNFCKEFVEEKIYLASCWPDNQFLLNDNYDWWDSEAVLDTNTGNYLFPLVRTKDIERKLLLKLA